MGATIAFLIGRYVLQSFVSSIVRRVKWLQALDNAFEVRGFTVVMLMRLSPAVPYNVFNYVVAGTKVTLRDFVCASVGMLPGTFSITLIGSSTFWGRCCVLVASIARAHCRATLPASTRRPTSAG